MSQQLPLTIVFGFRDRDAIRVQRCLDSLAAQTVKDFTVLFVDYGSQSEVAAAIRPIVASYPFCRYLYSDTRGYPWNRSRALNIGIRQAASTYTATSDVDMIFAPNFCAAVLQQATSQRLLQCRWHFLSRRFADWEQVSNYTGQFLLSGKSGLGGFQCAPTEAFHSLRGFDEFYHYYGVEDRDVSHRLRLLGLEEVWLTEST